MCVSVLGLRKLCPYPDFRTFLRHRKIIRALISCLIVTKVIWVWWIEIWKVEFVWGWFLKFWDVDIFGTAISFFYRVMWVSLYRYLREVVCPALSAPQQPLFFSNGNTATSNFGSNPQNLQNQATNILSCTFWKRLLQSLQEKIKQTKIAVIKI